MGGLGDRFRSGKSSLLGIRKRDAKYGPNRYCLIRIGELRNSQTHLFVRFTRLSSVSGKDAVPPGDVETVITIGFVAMNRMVNAMHIGCHQHPTQDVIQWSRDFEVAVVEDGT